MNCQGMTATRQGGFKIHSAIGIKTTDEITAVAAGPGAKVISVVGETLSATCQSGDGGEQCCRRQTSNELSAVQINLHPGH